MLCYKDRSFCSQECANRDCSRNVNDDSMADAQKWRYSFDGDPPVLLSMADFKTDNCGYLPLNANNRIK